jgi:acetyl-CoA carboxylase carboxyl transferase subunit alpha
LDQCLPFERSMLELELRIKSVETDEERESLAQELDRERQNVFANLTPWQRVLLARHAQRPRMLDYVTRLLDDLVELHGDRAIGDDAAMIAGVGRFEDQTVVVVGQQKGVTTEEKVKRNFGMANPQGYRKAMRAFQLAERLHLPIVTFVDTPAAYPGVEAEAHGQGPLIAESLRSMMSIKTPIFSAILGEGGSGGALAVAVADWIAMLEHAIYVICPPERCAEILWRDVEKKELAASALRVTAAELKQLGVIDAVVPEPPGGAHRDPDAAAEALRVELRAFLEKAREGAWTVEKRRQKFRSFGVWGQQQ